MTLGTLRTAVASKLGLNNTAGGAEQLLIDQWINEGIVQILLRTHCTVEYGSMDTIANVWSYQLDTDILAIRDIWREDTSGGVQPVQQVSEQEVLEYRRYATSSNASFTKYAVVGSNLLILWPTPSAVYALKMLYVPRPTVMSDGLHDPSSITYGRIPTEFHKAIEYYALWQGGEFDDSRPSQFGEKYRAMFEDMLTRTIKTSMQRKGNVGRPRGRNKSWRPGRSGHVRENDRY